MSSADAQAGQPPSGDNGQSPSNQQQSQQSGTIREETFTVKNRSAAEKQLTLQQLMREAQNFVDVEATSTLKTFHNEGEVQKYKEDTRNNYRQQIGGRGKRAMTTYIVFARWEATMKEFDRARGVFEEALSYDPHNTELWLHYINMELSHGAVQSARNVYRKAVTAMPNQMKLWYKWLELEEKIGTEDTIRAIYAELAQPRLETGVLPPAKVYEMYIAFETKHREFQNCVNVFEEFLSSYPLPATYMHYAQFALYNGHLVDISKLYSSKQQRRGSVLTQGDQSDNVFLDMHHSHTKKPSSFTSPEPQSLYSTLDEPRPLTPRMVFERAINELKIIPILQSASNFEKLHLHLLLSQLELGNRTSTVPTGAGVTSSNMGVGAIKDGELPVIKSTADLLKVQDHLQTLPYPQSETVDAMVELLLFWASLEEELQNRKAQSRGNGGAGGNDYGMGDGGFGSSSSSSSTNSSLPTFNLDGSALTTTTTTNMTDARQVLYLALKNAPLRTKTTILHALLSFEKRNGDTVMLDLALLQMTRLRYQDSLGISYPSLLALIIPPATDGVGTGTQNGQNDGQNGQNGGGKNSKPKFKTTIVNHHSTAPLITRTMINGRLAISVPILKGSHLAELQPKVRDYDLWLEWANVEQSHIQEQADHYSLYTGNITDALLIKLLKQGSVSAMSSKDPKAKKALEMAQKALAVNNNTNNSKNWNKNGNKNGQKSKSELTPFSPIPEALSYLHKDVLSVYETASKFIPITPEHGQQRSNSNNTTTNNHLTYSISTRKQDWRRFVFIAISHAVYLELYCNDIKAAKKVYLEVLDQIPKNSFTFSNLWINLALIQLRLRVQEYNNAVTQQGQMQNTMSDFYQQRVVGGGDLGNTKVDLDQMERELYSTTVKDVRAIFGRGIGNVKSIVAAQGKLRMERQGMGGAVMGDNGQNNVKSDENIKLFLAYIRFEQQIYEHTRVRELFNAFLNDFATNFNLWENYINFESQIDPNSPRARGLINIALGLGDILTPPPNQIDGVVGQAYTSILLGMGQTMGQDGQNGQNVVQPPRAFDTSRYLLPLIQYKQFTDQGDKDQYQVALNAVSNKLPLGRQIVPKTTPLINTQAQIDDMWTIYTQQEFNRLTTLPNQYWSSLATSYTSIIITAMESCTGIDAPRAIADLLHKKSNFAIFTPHPNYAFVSMVPYLHALLPSLADVCLAYEMWILTQPLNLGPYLKYAEFWGMMSTLFAPKTQRNRKTKLGKKNEANNNNTIATEDSTTTTTTTTTTTSDQSTTDPQSAQMRTVTGQIKGEPINPANIPPSLNPTTLLQILTLDYNSLFLSTLGTSTPPTTPVPSLQPLTQSTSLSEYCKIVGRYVLGLYHYRVCVEAKIVKRIQDQLLGKVNVIANEINQIDLKSSEELALVGGNIGSQQLTKMEQGDNGGDEEQNSSLMRLQQHAVETQRLSKIFFQLLVDFRGLVLHIYTLQTKRRDVIVQMGKYEDNYGSYDTTKWMREQLPKAEKKSMSIMVPKETLGGGGDDDIDDTKVETSNVGTTEMDDGEGGKKAKDEAGASTTTTTTTTQADDSNTHTLKMLENAIQNVGQILQHRWSTEHYDYVDLIFPLDSMSTMAGTQPKVLGGATSALSTTESVTRTTTTSSQIDTVAATTTADTAPAVKKGLLGKFKAGIKKLKENTTTDTAPSDPTTTTTNTATTTTTPIDTNQHVSLIHGGAVSVQTGEGTTTTTTAAAEPTTTTTTTARTTTNTDLDTMDEPMPMLEENRD